MLATGILPSPPHPFERVGTLFILSHFGQAGPSLGPALSLVAAQGGFSSCGWALSCPAARGVLVP